VTIIGFALGLVGLVKAWRRTGRIPPVRALVPWLAIFVWYAAVSALGNRRPVPGTARRTRFSISSFPARVEVNRASANKAVRLGRTCCCYAAALLALAFARHGRRAGPAMSVVTDALGIAQGSAAPVLILYFINIHHYFTDGVIWKISNPEVRRDLFAHVMPCAGRYGSRASGAERSQTKAPKSRSSRRGDQPIARASVFVSFWLILARRVDGRNVAVVAESIAMRGYIGCWTTRERCRRDSSTSVDGAGRLC
jgi:hypothetical protein